ncbi:MAG: hypothetical protein H6636_02435 [Anaerolineales bacterium]|nr:hypothetical protein [Anaerolineales bacterium]
MLNTPINKVFGIGFHKTGTTSLAVALYILGFNVTGYFGTHDPQISEKVHTLAYEYATRYDAAQDMPWPVLFKELDILFPNSKFILTRRPTHEWIKSVVAHFKYHYIPLHAWIYGHGRAFGNEKAYLQRYKAHNQEVLEYFKDRPQDLLVMDFTEGDGWEKLCPFLGKEIPPCKFPLQNTAKERSGQKLTDKVQRRYRQIFLPRVPATNQLMPRAVNSVFLRDIVHYHYASFTLLIEGIKQCQLHHEASNRSHEIFSIWNSQIAEERNWLAHLKGKDETQAESMEDLSTEASFLAWKETQFLVREYVAHLTEDACNLKAPGRNEYVWEILTHLVNQGNERRAHLRKILRDAGTDIDTLSFLDFFHK